MAPTPRDADMPLSQPAGLHSTAGQCYNRTGFRFEGWLS